MLRLLSLLIMLQASSGEAATDIFLDHMTVQKMIDQFLLQQGGGTAVVDARLNLPLCDLPTGAEWSDSARHTVRMTCRGNHSWQVYIPVSRKEGNRQEIAAAKKSESNNALTKLVRRGDRVFLRVVADGYDVTVSAIALADGRMGDAIRARVDTQAPPQEGIVTGAGIVTVLP